MGGGLSAKLGWQCGYSLVSGQGPGPWERLHLPQGSSLVPGSQEQMRYKAEGHGKMDFEAGPVSSTDLQKPLLERQPEFGEATGVTHGVRGKASCELDG